MADDIQWLRDLEQSTKSSMMKFNSRARNDALKRSESDLSVHKWAQSQSFQSPLISKSSMDESTKRRKRPLSSESSFTSGARIMLSSNPLHDHVAREEASRTIRLLPQDFVQKLPQELEDRRLKQAHNVETATTRYDPLPSLETISKALASRKGNFSISQSQSRKAEEDENDEATFDSSTSSYDTTSSAGVLGRSTTSSEVSGTTRIVNKRNGSASSGRRRRVQESAISTQAFHPTGGQSMMLHTIPNPHQHITRKPAKDMTTKDIYLNGGPHDPNLEYETQMLQLQNRINRKQLFTDGINFQIPLVMEILRSKYRDDIRREQEWEQYQVNIQASKDIEQDEGIFLDIQEVERHPIPRWLNNEITQSNNLAKKMIRARNRLPRNIKNGNDLKAVWQNNLLGLREHSTFDQASGLVSGGAVIGKGKRSLKGGRDSEGISEGSSQVQSVALLRALAGAYFTHEPPIEPKPAPPNSDPAFLPLPPPTPPTLLELSSSKPLVNFMNHFDGYGEMGNDYDIKEKHPRTQRRRSSAEQFALMPNSDHVAWSSSILSPPSIHNGSRYLVSVHRLTRPHSQEARWRVSLYDRYNGESRRHLMTESEAEMLCATIRVRRGSITSSNKLLMRRLSIETPGLQTDELKNSDSEQEEEKRSKNEVSSVGGESHAEEQDTYDDENIQLNPSSAMSVQSNSSNISSLDGGGFGTRSGVEVSALTDFSVSSTLDFEETGHDVIQDDTLMENIRLANYLSPASFSYPNMTSTVSNNGSQYAKHCEMASMLSQLVQDPDLEDEDTLTMEDLTINGLKELRVARVEAAIKADENARLELLKKEEEALKKDSKLRELSYERKERKKMFKEEQIERYRLAMLSLEEEASYLHQQCSAFFLMCDRTVRGTIRKKSFVEVLSEEPEVTESLRIMHCMPLQALPEQDRDESGQRGAGPPSIELLEMIFDEVDESGGYISGEIPISDFQNYIIERTGKHQKIDVGTLVFKSEEEEEKEEGETGSSTSSSTSSASFLHTSVTSATTEASGQPLQKSTEVEPSKELKQQRAEEKWHADNCRGGGASWESESDDPSLVPCLSIRVSDRTGGCIRSRMVPGVVVIGRPGLWWPNELEEERTSAVGVFFRDVHAVMTHVPTVVMTMLLALDTPKLAETQTSWETDSRIARSPIDVPHAPLPPPLLMVSNESLRKISCRSPYDTLMSTTVNILSDAAFPSDYKPLKLNLGKGESIADPHRRFWRYFNSRRFRQRIPTSYTLFPCKETVSWTFAVNKSIIRANEPALCKRHTWHSEQRCVEALGRKRGPKDLLESLDHKSLSRTKQEEEESLANESCIFMSRMDGTQLWALERWTFNSFETLYEEIAKQKEDLAKEEALASKVQTAAHDIKEADLARKKLENGVASTKAKKRDKKFKGKVRPEFGIEAWESRLKRSVLLMADEVIGSDGYWEKWMDTSKQGSGAIFYRHVSQLDPLPYQWDAPLGWNKDAVSEASNELKASATQPDSRRSSTVSLEGSQLAIAGKMSLASQSLITIPKSLDSKDDLTPRQQIKAEVQNDSQVTSPRSLELLAPDARKIAEQHNLRRKLLTTLVHNPNFVSAMVKKLVAVRKHLELKMDQNGRDVVEDHDPEEGRELGSDEDPWSSSDDEAGDWDGEIGFQPMDYGDLRKQRIAQQRVENERGKQEKRDQRFKRRQGYKNKPTVPEIELPNQEPALPGGVGRRTVPRLLRPGIVIEKEKPAIDESMINHNSSSIDGGADLNQSSALTRSNDVEGSVSGVHVVDSVGGVTFGDNQLHKSTATDTPLTSYPFSLPNPVSLFQKGGNRNQDELPVSAGRLRWEAMAPPGRPLAPHMKGAGWRNMPKELIEKDFVSKLSSTKLYPKHLVKAERVLQPSLVGQWDVREATGYQPASFEYPLRALLVRGDHGEGLNDYIAKKANQAERRTELSELMARELPVQEMVRQKEAEGVTAFTCLDKTIEELAHKPKPTYPEIVEKARIAVLNGEINTLEMLIENHRHEVNFGTCEDRYGNTLLMIAVQQGDMRYAKYLMRKHSDLNHQNHRGNTCLHYAYEYNNTKLGEYLESKGADPTIVNAEGCTCYEGLTRKELDSI